MISLFAQYMASHYAITALQGNIGEKGPVCETYAKAFKLLCNARTIPCEYITGRANRNGVEGGHGWNAVQMEDRKWYVVDITWNDPSGDSSTGVPGLETEDYLLIEMEHVVDDVAFCDSHLAQQEAAYLTFTNYPVVSKTAYMPISILNRIIVDAVDLNGQSSVWIDGKEYTVNTDNGLLYVNLLDSSAKTMVVYTYGTSNGKSHPNSMEVWALSNTDGFYTATRVEELDNILKYSGISIRVTGKQGIRMLTSIDKSKKNSLISDGLAGYTLKEYGTVVAWASKLENGNPLVLGQSYVMSNYAYRKGIAVPVFAYDGNLMQYTNVLMGFSLDQCKDDLAMRPYFRFGQS